MGDFGYKEPTPSINGWLVGGTHKAWYRVKEKDYNQVNRERIYVQCNCNLGYDHEANMNDNPDYQKVVAQSKGAKDE